MKKQFKDKAKKKGKAPEDDTEFKIYCDMDGVLTDFDSHAKAHNKFNEKGQPKWEELDYDWWSTMPAYEGAKEFDAELRKLGRTRKLSAPILNVGCFRGKAEWIKNFRGSSFGLLDLLLARAEAKNLLARPNHILVDDRQKNIDQWVAAGGIGILHTGDYADTLKRIREAQDEYRRNPPKPFVAKPTGEVEIFIGTNGVLADFQGHLETEGKLDSKGKEKWDELDVTWWKGIPAYTGAKEFYDAVKQEGPVRFLTGPVPHPDGFEGPAEWTKNFGRNKFALLDIIVCRSKDKMLLARPDKVLIDDRQENIDAWVKAGGIGILHKGDFVDTLKRVKEAVAEYNLAQGITPAPAVKPRKPK
ncbi:MAG: hypothetical protein ACAH83_11175 [Alphaproteobacteria bacterium]